MTGSLKQVYKNMKKSVISNHFSVKDKKSGFTLLFSVLVSVLILAVGASIISIALKQVILSGAGRESQFAFYAANTGLECALYWDLHPRPDQKYIFPATGLSGGNQARVDTNDWANIKCAGGELSSGIGVSPKFTSEVPWSSDLQGAIDGDYKFRISISNTILPVSYCAEVNVKKSYSSSTGRITTTINSRGLNTCDENSPRAVERGLVLEYQS